MLKCPVMLYTQHKADHTFIDPSIELGGALKYSQQITLEPCNFNIFVSGGFLFDSFDNYSYSALDRSVLQIIGICSTFDSTPDSVMDHKLIMALYNGRKKCSESPRGFL